MTNNQQLTTNDLKLHYVFYASGTENKKFIAYGGPAKRL